MPLNKHIKKGLLLIISFVLLLMIGILLLFGHQDIPLKELKSKYANSASQFIPIEGMSVHYRDEGNQNDSIPIILIHGTGSSLQTFDSWTSILKKSKRVIRMDLPAYGLTGPFPDQNYSMSHYISFLKEFLDSLKINRCIIAGNSLGGQIAWNFTASYPEKIQKMILIDAAGYPLISKSVPIAFTIGRTPVLNKFLTYLTPKFIIKASVENVFYDKSKVTDSLIQRYYDLTLREGNRQAFVDRFKMTPNPDDYKKIKSIKQPTLILWGAEDLLIPIENAYKFQKDLPKSSLVIIKNSGHTPMEENPVESIRPLLKFIQPKQIIE
jgi:pimeloyl-ACP methyl ester carboxylesterase